jgi:hypothetical protein
MKVHDELLSSDEEDSCRKYHTMELILEPNILFKLSGYSLEFSPASCRTLSEVLEYCQGMC